MAVTAAQKWLTSLRPSPCGPPSPRYGRLACRRPVLCLCLRLQRWCSDGLIHELFYFTGGAGGWLHNVPSAAAGSVPVRPGTSPTSWYTTPENVQHIAYVGTDQAIHELFYRIG